MQPAAFYNCSENFHVSPREHWSLFLTQCIPLRPCCYCRGCPGEGCTLRGTPTCLMALLLAHQSICIPVCNFAVPTFFWSNFKCSQVSTIQIANKFSFMSVVWRLVIILLHFIYIFHVLFLKGCQMTVNYLFISGEADVEELPYPKLKNTILKLYRKEIIQILITLPFTHVGFFHF